MTRKVELFRIGLATSAAGQVGKHVTALDFGSMTLINLIYVIVSFLFIAIPVLVTLWLDPSAQDQEPTII